LLAQFAAKLKGDDKGRARTFFLRLLAAFGHEKS
jgi:hypothetical protein